MNDRRKKIGLAVCYDTKNFGSQLQVLATIRKIEDLGYLPGIICYRKKLTPKFILQTIPRLFHRAFVSSKLQKRKLQKKIHKVPELSRKVSVRNHRFELFADRYFSNYYQRYAGWEQLVRQCADAYDIFLCGSDQLWLPANLGSHFYTLEFAPDEKPKIAYATSFGVSRIPEGQKKATRKYLERFQALSSREIRGREIIRELTGRYAEVVCDPTLLYDGEEWKRMIPEKRVVESPYIFGYLLGTSEEHREALLTLKEQTGLLLVTCPFLDNFVSTDLTVGDRKLFDLDSADFVNLIRNAEYVLTDSFHGTVFSILYHKKFLTFNRFAEGADSRNSRIDSICRLLELSNRRYQGNVMQVTEEIDFESADRKLQELRNKSCRYLADALNQ